MLNIREKVTYANVMATVAVFIALGAGAYAAGLPKNSVSSKQIKSGAVKSADLANNAVTTEKVKDGSLLGADFAAGQLPKGATGAQGPQGDQGVQGPAGPTLGVATAFTPPAAEVIFPGNAIDVDMPVAGHLFATIDLDSAGIGCNPAAAGDIGLYVDGAPIPGTDRKYASGASKNYNVSGVSNRLSAGSHHIAVGVACDGASVPTTLIQVGGASLTAILLGD